MNNYISKFLKKNITFFMLMLTAMLTLSGCMGGASSPSRSIETFMLFYPPHPLVSSAKAGESIAVERFSGAQLLRTGAMIYQPEPYKVDEYVYHRWRMPPGEMVSEFLRRDLSSSGLFKAVFGSGNAEFARYRIVGRVEDDGKPNAVLSFQVTVFDEGKIRGRQSIIVFQKQYRRTEQMQKQSPVSMVEAISIAMQTLSVQVVKDIAEISETECK